MCIRDRSKAEKIHDEFQRVFGIKELMLYLKQYHITPEESIRIWKAFGNRAKEEMEHDPYCLCQESIGIDFVRADAIAEQFNTPQDVYKRQNLLCGSLPVDGGKILVKGQNITKMKEFQRAKFIGRVFQDPSKGTCPELTILENMAMAEAKDKHFGLTFGVNRKRLDFYKSQLELLKLGLEDKLHIHVGSLSGGQRQALALLIATMTPIDLLVLDEHTAA